MRRVSLILAILTSTVSHADTIVDVNHRLEVMSNPMLQMAAYGSPVVRQWMADISLSEVGVAYVDETRDLKLNPQLGESEDYWHINAETYTKDKNSTLWGKAEYVNGWQRNVQYNETSDYWTVYPYVAADTVGGDLKMEKYCIAGGYASHTGRWSYGISLSYVAGLYHRNVDPRPKNVTGQLDFTVGAGYRCFRDYDLSAAVTIRRYAQSNDITSKSEMGTDKIYHLTGLGNHYHRFAGQGYSAHYGGISRGVTIDIFPRSRRGLTLRVEASRFTFDKVLKDLNELPLASVWHNSLSTQASWLAPGKKHDWAVTASFDAYRRHGTENIFGDASSNIYPQIGALEMYADNHWGINVAALYYRHTPSSQIWIRPGAGYSHRRQLYADPPAERLANRKYYQLGLGASKIHGKWRGSAEIDYRYIDDIGDIITPMLTLSRSLAHGYAMKAGCRYSHNRHHKTINIGLGIVF